MITPENSPEIKQTYSDESTGSFPSYLTAEFMSSQVCMEIRLLTNMTLIIAHTWHFFHRVPVQSIMFRHSVSSSSTELSLSPYNQLGGIYNNLN